MLFGPRARQRVSFETSRAMGGLSGLVRYLDSQWAGKIIQNDRRER